MYHLFHKTHKSKNSPQKNTEAFKKMKQFKSIRKSEKIEINHLSDLHLVATSQTLQRPFGERYQKLKLQLIKASLHL